MPTPKPTPPETVTEPNANGPEAKEVTPDGRSVAPTETVKQDKPEVVEDANAKPQSYVWLADGSVLRVNDEDLPGASGAQCPNGHWQRGNNVYEIAFIFPTESVVKES